MSSKSLQLIYDKLHRYLHLIAKKPSTNGILTDPKTWNELCLNFCKLAKQGAEAGARGTGEVAHGGSQVKRAPPHQTL